MVDQVDHRVVDVQPRRHLPGGDQVDAPHPRREQVHAAHRVAQLAAVDEPGPAARGAGAHRRVADLRQPPLARGVPLLVVAVDPGVDDVDRERALVRRRLDHQRQGAHLDVVDAGSSPSRRAPRHRGRVRRLAGRVQVAVGPLLPELHGDRAARGRGGTPRPRTRGHGSRNSRPVRPRRQRRAPPRRAARGGWASPCARARARRRTPAGRLPPAARGRAAAPRSAAPRSGGRRCAAAPRTTRRSPRGRLGHGGGEGLVPGLLGGHARALATRAGALSGSSGLGLVAGAAGCRCCGRWPRAGGVRRRRRSRPTGR